MKIKLPLLKLSQSFFQKGHRNQDILPFIAHGWQQVSSVTFGRYAHRSRQIFMSNRLGVLGADYSVILQCNYYYEDQFLETS